MKLYRMFFVYREMLWVKFDKRERKRVSETGVDKNLKGPLQYPLALWLCLPHKNNSFSFTRVSAYFFDITFKAFIVTFSV